MVGTGLFLLFEAGYIRRSPGNIVIAEPAVKPREIISHRGDSCGNLHGLENRPELLSLR
jgi:hypothetical protein